MKTHLKPLLLLLLSLISTLGYGQIVRIEPSDAKPDDEVKVIYDASEGTGGLVGATKVYMHSGVITSGPDGIAWQYVIGNWGQDDGIGEMTKVAGEDNLWEITLSPTIRDYYEVPEGTNIFRLSMVFRNADGSAEGKGSPGNFEGGEVIGNGDIFVDLDIGLFVNITEPASEIFVESGESFTIKAEVSTSANSIVINIDEGNGPTQIATASNTNNIEASFTPNAAGVYNISVEATVGTATASASKSVDVKIRPAVTQASPPEGLKSGINYNQQDPSKVTLSLLAPDKEFVYVVGDFTNWEINDNFLMRQSSEDPDRFFLEIDGLTPGQEYVYQYWVDGTIRIGDPYADKVADPYNDSFIPESVYPNLPVYDKTEYGIATVLQTNQQPYEWGPEEGNWQRPDPEKLVIYELLVRDFIGSHHYTDLIDSLSYLKNLGINAIELMPIMEFEGNSSWGYNPSYFFAVDKYYGTKNELKSFIEACHKEGIAVILDMVLNHAFGQNAMVRMYFDQLANKPSPDNPWFNPDATHPFNVGYDFNHESPFTKQFVDDVNRYWVEEYHFDGYRFDLSKGFTQTQNPNNVGAWGAYDQSRIDLLTRMADELRAVDEDVYIILEHFADPSEEDVLKADGMMVWGNSNHDMRQLLAGSQLPSTAAIDDPGRVSYIESHDEQRLMYEMLNFGLASGDYDTRQEIIALNRSKLAAAFFYTLPGPKMLWQFQELGYDLDINFNGRTGEKPLPWGPEGLGYYEDEERQKLLKATAAILNLTNEYADVFDNGNIVSQLEGKVRRISITHEELDVEIIGNFGLEKESRSLAFSKAGKWYDFFSGDSLQITGFPFEISLAPGQFHIYLDQKIQAPESNLVENFPTIVSIDPTPFKASEEITITFDATAANPAGTAGLVDAESVYLYAGAVLTAGSLEPTNFVGSLNSAELGAALTRVSGTDNLWQVTLTPQDYFGIQEGQRVFKIALKFRDESGENLGTGRDADFIFFDVEPEEGLQIVTVSPAEYDSRDQITITFDATASMPAGALVGVNKVYMHSGVITTGEFGTSWEYVIGNWGQDDGVGEMSPVPGEPNKWEITITPRTYYGVPPGTKIYRLGMVFRSANGSLEGKGPGLSDIFVDIPIVDEGFITSTPLPKHLKFYPNPVSGEVNIHFPGKSRISDVRLINMAGVEVRSYGELYSVDGNYQLNLRGLPQGVYLLRFFDGKAPFSIRLVKE